LKILIRDICPKVMDRASKEAKKTPEGATKGEKKRRDDPLLDGQAGGGHLQERFIQAYLSAIMHQ
jgi:hypothetical protein